MSMAAGERINWNRNEELAHIYVRRGLEISLARQVADQPHTHLQWL